MLVSKNNKILKKSFLVLIYAIVFSFILFGLPKYTYAQVKDKDSEVIITNTKDEKKAEKEEKKDDKEEEKEEEKEAKEEEKDEKEEGKAEKEEEKDEKEEEKDNKEEEKEEEKQEKEKNKIPHARMGYFLSGTNLVYFDATKSFDTDGSIVSYSWNFGDGNKESNITAGHIYSEPGRYWVSLTVIDDGGLKNRCYKNINIKENEYFYGFENILDDEQTEEFNNTDNYPVITDYEPDDSEKEPDLALVEFNQFLQGLLSIKKDEITENLGINLNRVEDLINIDRIIEDYKIVAVIDLNEIIDNRAEETNEEITNTLNKEVPEPIINFWNKFKDLAAFYN